MLYRLNNPAPGQQKRDGYGMRKHPITGAWSMHRGIDYGGQFPVQSASDGKVVHVAADWDTLSPARKRRQGGGNVVIIKHATDCYTVYYHGAHRSNLRVGQRVQAGDTVYLSGTTGVSTGNHLHFEVRTGRSSRSHTDPNPYFSASSATAPTNNTLRVTGRLDKYTWVAWQTALKGHGLYTGAIDGIPGRLTHLALQRWSGADLTGRLDLATLKAVQVRLGVDDDGVWGVGTVRELQKELLQGLAGAPTPEPEPIIAPPIVPIIVPEPVARVMTRQEVEAIRKRNHFEAMKDKK